MKKIGVVILIILMLITTMNINLIYANPFVLPVIAPELIPLIGAGLVGTGLTFNNTDDLKGVVEKAVIDVPEILTYANIAYRSAQTYSNYLVAPVEDNLWNALKNWTQTNFNTGDNNITYTKQEPTQYNIDTLPTVLSIENNFGKTVILDNGYYIDYVIEGGAILVSLYKSDGTYKTLGGVPVAEHYKYEGVSIRKYWSDSYNKWIIQGCIIYSSRSPDGVWTTRLDQYSVIEIYQVPLASVATYTGVITGNPVLDNPAHDLGKTTEGKRLIGFPVPGVLDGLIGKNPSDVDASDGTSTVGETPTTGTETGLLSNIWAKINSLYNSVTGAITRFFDTNTDINYEPLKVTGALFTTRFPFSLPWDLMRSFQLFNDNSFNPVLNINIPKGPILPEINFNLDLNVWSNVVGYVKVLELLIFDISLVLLTRRLLGGGV